MLTQIKTCPPGQRREVADTSVIGASSLQAQAQQAAPVIAVSASIMQTGSAPVSRSLQ